MLTATVSIEHAAMQLWLVACVTFHYINLALSFVQACEHLSTEYFVEEFMQNMWLCMLLLIVSTRLFFFQA